MATTPQAPVYGGPITPFDRGAQEVFLNPEINLQEWDDIDRIRNSWRSISELQE